MIKLLKLLILIPLIVFIYLLLDFGLFYLLYYLVQSDFGYLMFILLIGFGGIAIAVPIVIIIPVLISFIIIKLSPNIKFGAILTIILSIFNQIYFLILMFYLSDEYHFNENFMSFIIVIVISLYIFYLAIKSSYDSYISNHY
ncbi:hypothetical protein Cycma_2363 [Cyclobacterium marinum DSM 745]|uniref:Uncharacterized protein n=1 Tax=Cyclobacterium marinum (strain ATCC 25205 / DSM 745 / LMG 13164 / NCIMB 1802) TaxID=880070 RepID=G0J6Q7_CYCMS|nr:hypothetical protein Cycma_2363 [Cyclobacterium marinum DSM 745]|tara:strand:- start:1056 stop:1481 length:426 start_codon:yes stop_codon:yes gene_type:complete